MNRIRKTFGWLWRSKEQAIFLVTVLVLTFQIYNVFQTTEADGEPIPSMPTDNVQRLDPEPPEEVPAIPPQKGPIRPDSIIQNDPFVYQERGGASSGGGDQESSSIKLLNIMAAGDSYRVQIETESRKGWYKVGDAFETYELVSVDDEDESIEIFDESTNRRTVVYLED